jgi:hypothetical protein
LNSKDPRRADESEVVVAAVVQEDSPAVAWNEKRPVLNGPEGIGVAEVD